MLRPTVTGPVCLGVIPPILGPRRDFCYYDTVGGLLRWGTVSDEKTGLLFTITAGPRQRSHSQVRVRGSHDQILLSQIRDSPNLKRQVPIFITPKNRVAQLHPQALSSLFVVSYDSQGYGGGIRTRFHAVTFTQCVRVPAYIISCQQCFTEQQSISFPR
jgi:hypothetical protein